MSSYKKMRFPCSPPDSPEEDLTSDSEFSSGLPSIFSSDEDDEWESNISFGSSQPKSKYFKDKTPSEESPKQKSSQPKGGKSCNKNPKADEDLFQDCGQNKHSAPKRKNPQNFAGCSAKECKIPRKDPQTRNHEKQQQQPSQQSKTSKPESSSKEQKKPDGNKTGHCNQKKDESAKPKPKTRQPDSKRVQPKRQAKSNRNWRFECNMNQTNKRSQNKKSSTNKTTETKPSMEKTDNKDVKNQRPSDNNGRYVPTGPLSNSRRWLQDGSHHYKSVIDNLPWKVKMTRLNMALNSYYKALNIAETLEDKASASKNMGLASWKMAAVLADLASDDKKVHFYYKEGMKSLHEAKEFGKDMPKDWMNKLEVLSSRCWEEIQQCYGDLDLQKRYNTMRVFVPYIVSNLHKAEAYLSEVDLCFKAAINAIQKKDFKLSLSLLRDCYFPLNEAKRFGLEFDYVMSEVKVYEKDTFLHMCIAESMQALKLGDELYVQLIEEEESLNMELVYEVMDLYKQSILLTRDQDLELEAKGHSRIGQMYDSVLKNKYRAKQNFRYALDLALAMEPRNFYMEEWYKTAANKLSQYQQEIDNDEETKRQRERDSILLELKEEVKQLRNSFDRLSKWEFLQFVYKTFPPKKKSHTLGEITTASPEGKTLKKLYQKAVVHYHPDKADEKKHGKQWKVFSEEITKYLTQHYNTFKGF